MNWLLNNPYGRLTMSFTPCLSLIVLFSLLGWSGLEIFFTCLMFFAGIVNIGLLSGAWRDANKQC